MWIDLQCSLRNDVIVAICNARWRACPKKDHGSTNNVTWPQEATPTKPQRLMATKKAATWRIDVVHPKKGLQQCKQWGCKETTMSCGRKNHNDKGTMLHAPKKASATQNNVMQPQKVAMNHQCLAATKMTKDWCHVPQKRTVETQNNVTWPKRPCQQNTNVMQPQKKAMTMKLECCGLQKGPWQCKTMLLWWQITNWHGLKKAATTKQECCGLWKGSRQCKIPMMTTLLLTCRRVDCYFVASGKFQNVSFLEETELGMYRPTAFPELKFFVLVLGHSYGIQVVLKNLVQTC